MNAAEEDAVTRRVAEAAAGLLASGCESTTVQVPELGETWAITREGASEEGA